MQMQLERKLPQQAPAAAKQTNERQPQQIRQGLFLLIDSANSAQDRKVKNLLSIFEGQIPVYLCYNDTRKKFVTSPRNGFK